MPMRALVNDHVFAEVVRRLLVLGCIMPSPQKAHTYTCTELGDRIMQYYWDGEDHGYEFHVVYLLARATTHRQNNPEVLRVLVRIAALVSLGFYLVCEPNGWFEGLRSDAQYWAPSRMNNWVVECKVAKEASTIVRSFEAAVGLEKMWDRGWIKKPLEAAQLQIIDQKLI
ncbi:hypothetical protein Hte_009613 [Hypoxylon texense]